MDKRMDKHDVYKVETISDQYLVVSGVPKKNGDKHAEEICNMALDLKAACGSVVRPDIAPRTITIQAGIHTGKIVAGVVGSKMPRYCLFGDTINTTSRMQSSGEANKIQVSKNTWLLLSMKGGYEMEERGMVEIKGKGQMQTYWLIDSSRAAKQEKKKE
jgi:class 3 adenylate cyclase